MLASLLNNSLIQKYGKKYLFPAFMLAYMLGNIYMLIYKRSYFYPYNLLPLILFIVYAAIFYLEKLVFFLAFATPLAISLKEMGLSEGPDLSIPTEPVMAGIMLVYILNQFSKGIIDRKVLSHPVTLIIMLQLAWMLVTVLGSTMPVVSFKYFVSRLWFIFSCYIIIPHLFQDKKNIVRFVFAYGTAMAIVVAYTTIRHAGYNFNDKAADWVVSPFYNDHTAYGAALAMFIPVMVSFWFSKTVSPYYKIYAAVLFGVFVLAVILSFARAAWLSLAVALSIYLTILLRIKFRTLLSVFLAGATFFLIFQTEILMILGRNDTDAKGGFGNNVESISNISTDASNLERLNRWSCALRMWEDKPYMGWGPGTYMFQYAPYQLSHELTIISTNFGTNGNAHSEYLGPLAEQGVPGMVIVLALLLYATSLGYRLAYTLEEKEDRILCMGLFLGLMTYFVHGFFNNFLDTDKLSLPFWAFLAGLVTIDVLYKKHKTATSSNETTRSV